MGKHVYVPREVVDITEHFNSRRFEINKAVLILNRLHEMEYYNPILHGGWLRDTFLGVSTRDFDVVTIGYVRPDDSPQVAQHPRRVMRLKDIEIDINYDEKVHSASQAARMACVPLCSPAMGRNGQIWAHKDFLQAASEHIYAPDSLRNRYELKRMLNYFVRLREKIHDLKLVLPTNPGPQFAGMRSTKLLPQPRF